MSIEYIALFIICLITHIIRSLYEILKLNNKVTPENKLVYGLMVLNMSILWISWFMMCEVDTFKLDIPVWVSNLGFATFILGVFLFVYTYYRLKTFDNYKGDLVKDGIFSFIRHPMYLGFIFWVLGYAVYQQSKYALMSSIIWIPNILYWRKIEEKQLALKYPEFEQYKKDTYF